MYALLKTLLLMLILAAPAAAEDYNLFEPAGTLSSTVPLPSAIFPESPRFTPASKVVFDQISSVVSIYGKRWKTDKETGVREKVNGSGTGFVVDSRGYIVTAYHVAGFLAEEEGIEVWSFGATKGLKATLVGVDKTYDVAVLKIESETPLQVTRFNTTLVMPGEPAITIGNARGFTHSIQIGHVAGLCRKIAIDTPDYKVQFDDLLQTNDIILPGNSGGPVFNIFGDVIGMCESTYDGEFGFAVPAADVKREALKIMKAEAFQ